jgi:ribosomal protein S18 acetylase RimI-like enzyme
MAEGPQQLTGLRRIAPEDAPFLADFLYGLPEGDRTFFKEDIDAATVERWCQDERAARWMLVGEDGAPEAFLAIIPGVAWSAHVGELRLIVGAQHRRQGIGRRLARFAVTEGVRMGLRKLIVEVVADKQSDIAMFTAIGFDAEALLTDHISDRAGNLRDLVILSHSVEDVSGSMGAGGLDLAVEDGG